MHYRYQDSQKYKFLIKNWASRYFFHHGKLEAPINPVKLTEGQVVLKFKKSKNVALEVEQWISRTPIKLDFGTFNDQSYGLPDSLTSWRVGGTSKDDEGVKGILTCYILKNWQPNKPSDYELIWNMNFHQIGKISETVVASNRSKESMALTREKSYAKEYLETKNVFGLDHEYIEYCLLIRFHKHDSTSEKTFSQLLYEIDCRLKFEELSSSELSKFLNEKEKEKRIKLIDSITRGIKWRSLETQAEVFKGLEIIKERWNKL